MDNLGQVKKFVFVIGNARSGTTLLGAALDSHPSVVLANETDASAHLWRGLDRHAILSQTYSKAIFDHANSRPSEGYTFSAGISPESKTDITVIGDKIHNPTMLYLHGDYTLIPCLAERLEMPLYFIHTIRNPFDVIATMHHRSGAPVSNRIRWYFMHCEAAAGISERISEKMFLHTYHEDLVHSTEKELGRLCHFLDLDYIPALVWKSGIWCLHSHDCPEIQSNGNNKISTPSSKACSGFPSLHDT